MVVNRAFKLNERSIKLYASTFGLYIFCSLTFMQVQLHVCLMQTDDCMKRV